MLIEPGSGVSSVINRRAFVRNTLAVGGYLGTGAIFAGNALAKAADAKALPGERWIRLSNGYRVWTRRLGQGPRKLLLLNGGPGLSHEYLEIFARHLPQGGYEIYFYDQLGCGRSDRPDDPGLWTLDRYTSEVEEVRAALGLEQFVLYGHSWGGILGLEYTLRHQQKLAGFILSDMTASFSDYARYTKILRAGLPADVRERLDALEQAGKGTSEAFNALLEKELYSRYICRLKPWPEPVQRAFTGINAVIYNQMQGPNEFAMTGNLKNWDRWAELPRIKVPTLVMGARYDEMDPRSIRREARLILNSSLFVSETGSHLSMWDDERNYFAALLHYLATSARWRV